MRLLLRSNAVGEEERKTSPACYGATRAAVSARAYLATDDVVLGEVAVDKPIDVD